jgi:hypothetical protein
MQRQAGEQNYADLVSEINALRNDLMHIDVPLYKETIFQSYLKKNESVDVARAKAEKAIKKLQNKIDNFLIYVQSIQNKNMYNLTLLFSEATEADVEKAKQLSKNNVYNPIVKKNGDNDYTIYTRKASGWDKLEYKPTLEDKDAFSNLTFPIGSSKKLEAVLFFSLHYEPKQETLKNLGIKGKAAYVKYNNTLFYIDDTSCTKIPLNKKTYKKINDAFPPRYFGQYNPGFSYNTLPLLTQAEKEKITSITGHTPPGIKENAMALASSAITEPMYDMLKDHVTSQHSVVELTKLRDFLSYTKAMMVIKGAIPDPTKRDDSLALENNGDVSQLPLSRFEVCLDELKKTPHCPVKVYLEKTKSYRSKPTHLIRKLTLATEGLCQVLVGAFKDGLEDVSLGLFSFKRKKSAPASWVSLADQTNHVANHLRRHS